MEGTEKIKYLVADTTAFINAVPLNEFAENVLTVPDVISEVRNKRQIRRLCVIPFDLQIREPRIESVKHCVEFAKKTGDYASLSGIDIKVIALSYELEVEHVGDNHLRKDPVISQVIASKDKPPELEDKTKLAGWYNPERDEESDSKKEDDTEEEEDDDDDDDNNEQTEDIDEKIDLVKQGIEKQISESEENCNYNDQDEVSQEELEILFEKLKCDPVEGDNVCDILVPEGKNKDDSESAVNECNAPKNIEGMNAYLESHEENEDDDNSWITPSNIKKVKKALEGKVEEDSVPIVACMSTDFAIQNVAKQINLKICALNGRVIKNLRTYIFRCYTCFKTTSIMTKVFCGNCGNKTLKRVAVSLDENGKQVIHINTRRALTTKYKNQSVPRFRGGKHSRNPILFEDQPIPRQMPSRVAKTKTNALNEDYIAGISPFVMRDLDSKSAMLRSKGNLKEWARNNNFEEDRRKKHYNRLYK